MDPNAAPAALVKEAQAAQRGFCEEWRSGKPRPGGLPDNGTYVRVAGVPMGLGSAGAAPYYVLATPDIVSQVRPHACY